MPGKLTTEVNGGHNPYVMDFHNAGPLKRFLSSLIRNDGAIEEEFKWQISPQLEDYLIYDWKHYKAHRKHYKTHGVTNPYEDYEALCEFNAASVRAHYHNLYGD